MNGKGQELYKKAKQLIPGGTQLLSKRPEMFLPDQWPAYYGSASGCEVEDLDGRRYRDMSIMGVGSCILGYADPDVNRAVINAVEKGNMATLNAPEEVELAELLLELHPWAEMVRYARTGGEAMAMAVRIARAATQKDLVLFCGYHGWSDWYLSANLSDDAALDGHLLAGLEPRGVPRGLLGTALPFVYNDTEELNRLVDAHGDRIAAIVMEPIRNEQPTEEFREAIHAAKRRLGVPLVLDEITAGFRLNVGGAHLLLGLEPDVAVFAKGMSNGHPMATVIGSREIMESAQLSFISSTYWTDRAGPAAALATIRKMQDQNVPAHLSEIGTLVQGRWFGLAESAGLHLHVGGIPPLSHFGFEAENALELKTLFTQLMLDRGYLAATGLYVSLAHTASIVEEYLEQCGEVFGVITEAIKEDRVKEHLLGPTCHAGFQRLT